MSPIALCRSSSPEYDAAAWYISSSSSISSSSISSSSSSMCPAAQTHWRIVNYHLAVAGVAAANSAGKLASKIGWGGLLNCALTTCCDPAARWSSVCAVDL